MQIACSQLWLLPHALSRGGGQAPPVHLVLQGAWLQYGHSCRIHHSSSRRWTPMAHPSHLHPRGKPQCTQSAPDLTPRSHEQVVAGWRAAGASNRPKAGPELQAPGSTTAAAGRGAKAPCHTQHSLLCTAYGPVKPLPPVHNRRMCGRSAVQNHQTTVRTQNPKARSVVRQLVSSRGARL
jgi:hypothetical protein